ncbi:MAG: hypothetical protein KC466_01705 [Myxococcales bacterium]|nr:hypothetical protein [Myxococcales bacterium]
MRTPGAVGVTALAAALLSISVAYADPDLAVRIGILDDRIAEEPGNAELYLARAELYREAGDWPKVFADLDRVAAIRPDDPELGFRRGRALIDAGRVAEGRAALDRFLATHPDHAPARIERARLLARGGERDAAVRDWDAALAAASKPVPDLYLERARLLLAPPARLDDALAGIDQGVARLGPLVTFVTFAVDAEAARARPAAAIAWIDRLPPHLRALPRWLARRAELLDAAGKKDEALVARCDALTGLRALPPSRRAAKANAELYQALAARAAGRCPGDDAH